MATQDTDTVSTTETVDSPSDAPAAGNLVVSEVSEPQVFELVEEVTETPEETAPAEVKEEEQSAPETTEPKATEKPEETASEPAAETVEETPASPSVRESEEFRGLQAAADRQIAAAQLETRQAKADAVAAQSAQAIETQVEANRRELTSFFETQGITADQYSQRVADAGENLAGRLKSEAQAVQLTEAQTAQQQVQVRQNQDNAFGRLTAFTDTLTVTHKLSKPIADSLNQIAALGSVVVTEFQDAEGNPTPAFLLIGQAMSGIAEEIGKMSTTQAATTTAAAKLKEVPAGGPENQLDSGGAQSGSQSDDQFLALWNAGESDDIARAMAINEKRSRIA